MTRATGSIIIPTGRRSSYMRARVPDPSRPDWYRQVNKLLGPVPEWSNAKAEQNKDAKRKLNEFLGDLGRTPVSSPVEQVTLAPVAAAWLRWVEHDKKRKPSTLGDYRNTIGQAVAYFGKAKPIARSSPSTSRPNATRSSNQCPTGGAEAPRVAASALQVRRRKGAALGHGEPCGGRRARDSGAATVLAPGRSG